METDSGAGTGREESVKGGEKGLQDGVQDGRSSQGKGEEQ